MAAFLVLVIGTLLFRAMGSAGVHALSGWRNATRCGLAAMFAFTGATHFTAMRHDYAAMVPPPFTGQLWVIYVTGLLELAGATGLLLRRFQRFAGFCLFLLLLLLFPANVYAALNTIQFRGEPPTDIALRAAIQLVFMAAVWWSAVAPFRVVATPLQPAA